jgi:hypothetical protein
MPGHDQSVLTSCRRCHNDIALQALFESRGLGRHRSLRQLEPYCPAEGREPFHQVFCCDVRANIRVIVFNLISLSHERVLSGTRRVCRGKPLRQPSLQHVNRKLVTKLRFITSFVVSQGHA